MLEYTATLKIVKPCMLGWPPQRSADEAQFASVGVSFHVTVISSSTFRDDMQ